MPTNNQSPRSYLSILYISTFLERFIYFGCRSILFVFMVTLITEGGLGMDKEAASSIYGDFKLMIYLMPLIGALIADFLLTKLKTIICGGVTLFMGFVFLSMCSTDQLFYALIIIAFGFGLITPSIFGLLARSYSGQPAKLSGVFTLNYLVINLGAFFAPIVFGFILYPIGSSVAFYTLAALGSGLAFLLYYLRNLVSQHSNANEYIEGKSAPFKWQGASLVLLLVLLSFSYDVSYDAMSNFIWQTKLERVGISLVLQTTNVVTVLLIGTLFTICWFKYTANNWTKLSVGVLLYALSWQYIGYLISSVSNDNMLSYFVASEVVFTISELLILPVLFALIAEYSPKKIAATSYALVVSISALVNLAVGALGEGNAAGIPYIVFSSTVVSFLILLAYKFGNSWFGESVSSEGKKRHEFESESRIVK